MPRVSRKLEIGLPIDHVWGFVSNPGNLGKWWPRIVRVEGLVGQPGSPGSRWTSLLEADSGRRVRLDFESTTVRSPEIFAWQQELAGTQFEKHLRRQEYSVLLHLVNGGTEIELVAETELKGSARLAGLTLRKSQGELLDKALAGLADALTAEGSDAAAAEPSS